MAATFIWYELCANDPVVAAAFYGAVLGWRARDSGQPGMDYKMWLVGDHAVGGMLKINSAMATGGMAPVWLGYVDVENVDASVAGIVAAGGEQHIVQTVPGVGRMAMVSDPQGALIYVMTPNGDGPSPSYKPDHPGYGGWNELHTRDASSAGAFYRDQFGWVAAEAHAMGPMGDYLTFTANGEPIAGMFNSPGFPIPRWIYYFNVEEIDAAKARVEAAGGVVRSGPMQVPTGRWMINASDPEGVIFGLLGPRASTGSV